MVVCVVDVLEGFDEEVLVSVEVVGEGEGDLCVGGIGGNVVE